MILYDLCSAYESYLAHENITGTTYPYTTVEPKEPPTSPNNCAKGQTLKNDE